MGPAEAYSPDRSWRGKLRRRVRYIHRRPLRTAPSRPMLSFSFDDAPLTAALAGAEILEARGLRATYYVSGGLAGQIAPVGLCAQPEDYRRLAAAGHEIACHTYSHLDCGRASGVAAKAEAARNAELLSAWSGSAPTNFAYPYGDVSAGPKAALGRRFATLRALHHDVITLGTDLNQAPAVGIEGPHGEALARRWMQQALASNAWLILYTHDVTAAPSMWGCTPDTLARLADEALEAGFDIGTVAQIAQRLGLS